jgi:hypothetical protein
VHSQNCEKRLFASLYLAIPPSAWKNLAPIEQISMKFDIGVFFKNLLRDQVSLRSDKNNGYIT